MEEVGECMLGCGGGLGVSNYVVVKLGFAKPRNYSMDLQLLSHFMN